MSGSPPPDLTDAMLLVREVYDLTQRLQARFPGRPFTPDGHLVGSIGEVVAAACYDLDLAPPSSAGFDAWRRTDRKTVQVKLTARNHAAFRIGEIANLVLVLKVDPSTGFEEVFNGPGSAVRPHLAKAGSNGQHRISVTALRRLSREVNAGERLQAVRSLPRWTGPLPRPAPDVSARGWGSLPSV